MAATMTDTDPAEPLDATALRRLYDTLPDGVLVADADGTIVVANAPARRMLGEELAGRSLAELPLQDSDGREWYAVNRPYDGLASRAGLPEQSWLLPNGREVLVTTRISRTRRGGPVRTVALVVRSGRGRARLDRERSDLVATVAHELRSPLTGVKGFVTTLLSKWDRLNDEQKKLMLTTVSSDSERLSRLITELLDVARIDTGRLPLYPRDVPVGRAVDRVVESVGAATTRTILTEHADPDAVVRADADKLAQVLTNLVENAVRHGEGRVRVTTRPISTPIAGVEVVVDDEGEGIPEEIRARIFTKFWKHGASGGSGLGMYIVHGLTRAHGGTVEVGDAPGGGARIVVRWPAEEPVAG
jgi:signal transduction histidine kinase